MQKVVIRQFNENQRSIKVYSYSRRKKILLGMLPFLGLLIVILGITYDLYTIGGGNISPVSKAAWELYSTDKKIVKFSEVPEQYLALTKNVESEDKLLETMSHHNWKHIKNSKFLKNDIKVELDVYIYGRQFTILEYHKID